MGMSSVKQDVWFGWNVKNFAQNLLISPRSTQKGGQSTVKSERICREVEICRWGGRGGEGEGGRSTVKSEKICREVEICRWGGRGGEGGSIDSQLGKDL